MGPRISIVTLGVADIRKSTKFYKEFGFPIKSEGEQFVMFNSGEVVLALFPREQLAKDANVKNKKSDFSGITLAHNVKTTDEVDEIMKKAKKIGAIITDEPHKRNWGGYSGYFADLDGYLWEIAWNPHNPELAE